MDNQHDLRLSPKIIKQLGSSLSGLLYVFDEPSIGLHPQDIFRINRLFQKLKEKGNTILIVEHDPDVIQISDNIIEMGPYAGINGGQIMFTGDLDKLKNAPTLTAKSFNKIPLLKPQPRIASDWIEIKNASMFNIHNVSLRVPRNVLTVVTGVAGSGKSTLFNKILPRFYPDCTIINQKQITTNRRSNIATFSGVFDNIRELFATQNGVSNSLFSFNSKGSCPNCKGLGFVEMDLAFMDSVTDKCEVCDGNRFTSKVLSYLYRGKNISEILGFSVDEAIEFFTGDSIHKQLTKIKKIGLGYLTLGQSLTTLSGGELQRLKLAVELGNHGKVYVLDEPTTGLHPSDIQTLLVVFDEFIKDNSTLIVIEHNMEMMCHADWIIDLGPGAGEEGGKILFNGLPKEILNYQASYTGRHLQRYLSNK